VKVETGPAGYSTSMRKIIASGAVAAVALTGLAVIGQPPAADAASKVSAKTLLKKLPVKSERNRGYSRAKFKHWIDADRDSCDTREEVLIAESKTRARTGSGCRVVKGKWVSVYDGKRTRNSSKFDVDHRVPLAESWGSGAKSWNSSTRKRFANDLGYAPSLIAVSASSNRSKGARDPSEWMPKASNRCQYASQWVAVKYRWRLSVDKPEKRALKRQLNNCSAKQVKVVKPARAHIKKGSGGGGGGQAPGSGGTDRRYDYCYQAKDAGLGPYKKGRDAEYYWYRDADKDGIVCE
jgi:hypothetical protein